LSDWRENDHQVELEEAIRSAFDGLMRWHHVAMPCIVAKDGDGKVCGLQPAIKGTVTAPDGTQQQVDLPQINDSPLHYPGGGGMVTTHPVKKGEEALAIFASRDIDSWYQQGGVQNPSTDRMHSLSDSFTIHGYRSTPNAVPNVSADAHHVRSIDGKVTTEHHPTNGKTTKVVDPSDTSDNPFLNAVKHFTSTHSPTGGITHAATDGGTTHSHSVDHSGPQMAANNGAHSFAASVGGLAAQTAAAFKISTASGTNLSGGLNGDVAKFAQGAFGSLSAGGGGGGGAGNPITGVLAGDVTGPEGSNQVVGITHVANANTLHVAANDTAAAAAGVSVGGLYINQTSVVGQNLVCVRMV
jgi:hypothetical protein